MSTRSPQPPSFRLSGRVLAPGGGFDLSLIAFLGGALLVRVLTDNLSSPGSRQSGGFNLSGVIAVLFIVVAAGLLLRRRAGVLPTVLAVLWLCIWTAVAVGTNGATTETIREGVREASVVALAVIAYNSRKAVTVPVATRLVQLVGFVPAVLALYQLATDTGMDIAGHIRSNGTFAQPNSAAMFFAVAVIASLWRYLDDGRQRWDALLVMLFAAALIATFSIDGLITLLAMLMAYGVLHPGTIRVKVIPYGIAALLVLVFFATPVGAQRVAKESSTSLSTAEQGSANSSLAWRLHKWKTLIPEWERSPLFGRGLGTTITPNRIPGNIYIGEPPLNEYVRYLVETGIVGISILLAALSILIRRLFVKWRLAGAQARGPLNAAPLGLVIIAGCLVNSLADNTFLNSPMGYTVALIVMAVLASLSRETDVESGVDHAA
jgi:hypothetical protein